MRDYIRIGKDPEYIFALRVLDTDAEFKACVRAMRLEHEGGEVHAPADSDSLAGRAYNMAGGVDTHASIVVLNKSRLDLETLYHEIFHAAVWIHAGKNGRVEFDASDPSAESEESVNDLIGELTFLSLKYLHAQGMPAIPYRRANPEVGHGDGLL